MSLRPRKKRIKELNKYYDQNKEKPVGTLKIQAGIEPFGTKMKYKIVSTYKDSRGREYYLDEDGKKVYLKLERIKDR